MASISGRDSSPNATFKFPAFQPDLLPMPEEEYPFSSSRSASPVHAPQPNGSTMPTDRWQPRRDSRLSYANGTSQGPSTRHGRQKSLSEAIRTIRTRKASVSQNAHEIADALKAPLSPKLIVCRAPGMHFKITDSCRCSAVSGT